MFVATSYLYVEILIPSVMVLGDEAFGRCLSHEDRAINGAGTLYKRDPRQLPSPFYHVRTEREVCKLEEGSHPPCWHRDLKLTASRIMRNTSYFHSFTEQIHIKILLWAQYWFLAQ